MSQGVTPYAGSVGRGMTRSTCADYPSVSALSETVRLDQSMS